MILVFIIWKFFHISLKHNFNIKEISLPIILSLPQPPSPSLLRCNWHTALSKFRRYKWCWFDTFTYCNVMTTFSLANTSILFHKCALFVVSLPLIYFFSSSKLFDYGRYTISLTVNRASSFHSSLLEFAWLSLHIYFSRWSLA